MICLVTYFKDKARKWTDKNGVEHVDSEIMLLKKDKEGNGFIPLEIRTFNYQGRDGSERIGASAMSRIPAKIFEKFKPELMSQVNVDFDQYGHVNDICAI